MKNLRATVLAHVSRYPLMEPTDAVKLLYQNEFGGGHLIRDPQMCMVRLMEEYRHTPQLSSGDLTESIGNGLVRVYLNRLDGCRCAPEQLGEAFIRSAAQIQGNLDSFREKLELLQIMARENLLPFSASTLDAYLTEYEKAGFPMVSHSGTYRNAYHPAYRVVKASELNFNRR